MLNTSNICIFEGRITKDINLQTVGQGQNQYSKVLFSIACDRTLTKEQKQAKSSGQNVTSADFPQFVATGSTADIIAQYFSKGKPIRIFASYQNYTKQDQNGNNVYGHIFKVENIGFTPADNSGNQGGQGGIQGGNQGGNRGGNNYGNNYGNNKSNSGYGNSRNNQANVKDFFPVDDGDVPF